MNEITKEHDRIVWRKATILLWCMVARFISYFAAFAWAWGDRGKATVLGVWLLATYLSQFIANVIVDRIYGRTPGQDRSYFGLAEFAGAVATTVYFVGTIAGIW